MKQAYSYRRISSAPQETGDGLRRQTADTEAICKAKGWALTDLPPDIKSGWTGANLTEGVLGRFIDAVERGKVPKGSVLIVENLDRLTRQQITKAMTLLLRILSNGIEVFTSMDGKLYTESSVNANPMDLMYSLLIMMRGNEESSTKSRRVAKAWEQKRLLASQNKTPTTRVCPGWIKLVNGRYEIDPQRGRIMRKIIDLAMDGLGGFAIASRLNKAGVPNFSRRKMKRTWEHSTVNHVLRSRALIGEYQPMTYKVKGKGTPAGRPIPDYYPSFLTEREFYSLQSIMDARKTNSTGRACNGTGNLFGKLLVDDKGSHYNLHYTYRDHKHYIYLRTAAQRHGLADYRAFPYLPFEAAFLQWVTEVDLGSINERSTCTDLSELNGKLASVMAKREKVQKIISGDEDGQFDSMLQLLMTLDQQKADLENQIEEEKRKQTAPILDTKDIARLTTKLETLPAAEKDAARRRLRMAISQVVQKIVLTIHVADSRAGRRIAEAKVLLRSGEWRMFWVRTHMWFTAMSFSDTHAWRIPWDEQPNSLANMKDFLDCKTADEAKSFMEYQYPWPVEARIVPAKAWKGRLECK